MKIKTKGVAFKKLQQKLKRKNRAFNKLTKAKKRVAIAKDVITQVELGKILPASKYFMWGDYMDDLAGSYDIRREVTKLAEDNKDIDLSETLAQTTCTVCGIGSLFVGAVGLADKLKTCDFLEDFDERQKEVNYLKQWFDEEQLNLVEDYFELNTHRSRDGVEASSPIARAWGDKPARLIMIMENIISNNGRFNPHKGAHKVAQ